MGGSKIGHSGGALGTSVSETELSFTDITTANATSLKHGLLPKLSGSASDVLKGDGTFGAGGGASFTALTAGDLTVTNDGSNGKPFVATWSTAQVGALGAVTSGELTVAGLPARGFSKNVFVILGQRDNSGATLTVSVGRAGAAYIDYIAASDATVGAAAGAVYGNASGERGANNTGYDLVSGSVATDIKIQFVTNGTLDSVTTSGTVIVEYMVV